MASQESSSTGHLVDDKAFQEVIDLYAKEDAKREELIKKSRLRGCSRGRTTSHRRARWSASSKKCGRIAWKDDEHSMSWTVQCFTDHLWQASDHTLQPLFPASPSFLRSFTTPWWDLVKSSKQAIFAMHRKDLKAARACLDNCENVMSKDVFPITDEHPALRLTGLLLSGLEEYAEARIFLHFLETKKLLPFQSLKGLRVDEFLGGLVDCTGELNRFAVLRATEGDERAVHDAASFTSAVHEKMLLMDLRNSPLRRKYDALKYTQKRLEALVYELSVARRMHNIKLPSMMMEPEPESASEH